MEIDNELIRQIGELLEHVGNIATKIRIHSSRAKNELNKEDCDAIFHLSGSIHNLMGVGGSLKQLNFIQTRLLVQEMRDNFQRDLDTTENPDPKWGDTTRHFSDKGHRFVDISDVIAYLMNLEEALTGCGKMTKF